MFRLVRYKYDRNDRRVVLKILGIKLSFSVDLSSCYYNLYKKNKPLINFLDRILPKDNSKVVFTSYPDFSDSAFLFYQYLKNIKQDKFKKIIWIKDNNNEEHSEVEHAKVYLHTFQGVWHLLTSKYIIHDHCNKFLDYISSPNHVCFNVWHGSPIKAIGYGDVGVTKNTRKRYKYMAQNAYMFVSSDIYQLILSSMFQINPQKIFVTGVVKTDIIFNSDKAEYIKETLDLNSFKNTILYAPTYKTRFGRVDVEVKPQNLFGFENYNEEDFIKFLKEENICLLIKPHPFEEKIFVKLLKDKGYEQNKNIRIVTWQDLNKIKINLNEIFNVTDLIISDFSSITVDYAISNKPILYLYSYLDNYKQGRGFILPENYELLMPGETVENYNELKEKMLINLARKTANYTEKELQPIYKYIDGKSCERIFEIMKEL